MSIKTTKRLALGVIASLVFAPFAAVIPANAAADASTTFIHAGVGATTAANFTSSVSVAVGTRATINLTVGATNDADETLILTAALTSSPATTNGVAVNAIGVAGGATFATVGANVNIDGDAGANEVKTLTTTADGAVSSVQTLGYTPTVPGVYVITTTVTGTGAGTVLTNGSLTHVLTIFAGFSADSARANRVFPTQGTNITTGWTAAAGGQATIRITNMAVSTQYFVTTNSGVILSATANNARAGTPGFTNAINFTGGANTTTGNNVLAGDHVDVRITDLGAATTTVTVRSFNAGTGVASTFAVATVTWGAAPAASAQFSTSIIAAAAAAAGATDALNVSLARTIGGLAANITVTVRDQNNNPLAAGVSATITGPGLLSITPNTTQTGAAGTGRAISLTVAEVAANTDGTANVSVYADGTAGVATITISSGTVTLATETVTFFGTVATLTATQKLKVARASATGAQLGTSDGTGLAVNAITAALTPAVVIVAKDSNGNVVPGLTITGLSSNAAVISSTTVLQTVGTVLTTGAAGPGTYLASVTSAVGGTSGATATVTFRTPNPAAAGTFISATPLTFTLGGSVVTETLAFGKATYLPGEAVVVTSTAKDASGNPVFDGAAAPAVSFNKALGGTAVGASFYVGGVRATSATAPTVFAPVTFGEFTARATSGNIAKTVITATASVPAPAVPTVEVPQDKPTLTVLRDAGRLILSGTAVDGEGDIIVYVKRVGKTAWKERAKTLEVAAPGDFNGTIRAPKKNVVIRVKQEGTGLFSNQVIATK